MRMYRQREFVVYWYPLPVLGRKRPVVVLPDRALCLPTFSVCCFVSLRSERGGGGKWANAENSGGEEVEEGRELLLRRKVYGRREERPGHIQFQQ